MKETGGPAFPMRSYEDWNGVEIPGSAGMTLRQYAAIELRVPNSGTDWLDEMITKANRDGFAGLALKGLLANIDDFPMLSAVEDVDKGVATVAMFSYRIAAAMLVAREKE